MSLDSLSFAKLDRFRQVGDTEFDECFSSLMKNESSKGAIHQLLGVKTITNVSLREELSNLGLESLIPFSRFNKTAWDFKKIKNGAVFFEKNKDNIFLMLGILSLPYCYAASKGALVLSKSRRIIDNPAKRLADTAWFVEQVCKKGGFSDSGSGLLSCLQTRMTHSYVRFMFKHQFLEEESEMPINQEDMAGTFLSFSYILTEGLKKIGIRVSLEEEESFLYLWSFISQQIGLDAQLLTQNTEKAHRLEEIIRVRQFKPSKHGQELSKSLYTFLEKESLKFGFPPALIKDLSAFLLGKKVSLCLGLPANEFSSIEKTIFKRFAWFRNVMEKVN
ncbi:MAG: oxygenase MpaB family protein [Cytophagales bacterium]